MERVYLTYKGKNEMFFEGIYNSSDGFIYVGYTRCEFSQDHPKIYRDITKINGFMKVPACVCTQEVSLNIIPKNNRDITKINEKYKEEEFLLKYPKIYKDITKINGFMKVPACVCTQEVSLDIIPQLYFYSWDNVIFTNGVPEIIKDEFVKFVQEEINKVYL